MPPSVAISHAINQLSKSVILKDSILPDKGKPLAKEFLLKIIKSNNLSLREVEKLLNYLEIYHVLSGSGSGLNRGAELGKALSAILGVYLYYQDKRLSKDIAESGLIDVDAIAGILGLEKGIRSLMYNSFEKQSDGAAKTLLYVWAECDPSKLSSLAGGNADATRVYWRQYMKVLFEWPDDLDRREEKVMLLSIPILTLMMRL